MPVWHVSVCVRKDNLQPIKTLSVNAFMVRQVRAFGLELLAGVGEGQTKFEGGGIAFHLRRKINPVEHSALPKAWCDVQPIDDGGEMRLIEWIPAV